MKTTLLLGLFLILFAPSSDSQALVPTEIPLKLMMEMLESPAVKTHRKEFGLVIIILDAFCEEQDCLHLFGRLSLPVDLLLENQFDLFMRGITSFIRIINIEIGDVICELNYEVVDQNNSLGIFKVIVTK